MVEVQSNDVFPNCDPERMISRKRFPNGKSECSVTLQQHLSNGPQPDKMLPDDLIYVRYLDHLFFRYSNHSLLSPVLREAAGFIAKQTDEAIWLLCDRSVESSPDEQVGCESGLVILRSDIKEIRRIELE